MGESDWQNMWGVASDPMKIDGTNIKSISIETGARDFDSSKDMGSGNGKKLLRSFINASKDKTPAVRVAACRLLGT